MDNISPSAHLRPIGRRQDGKLVYRIQGDVAACVATHHTLQECGYYYSLWACEYPNRTFVAGWSKAPKLQQKVHHDSIPIL